MTRPSGPLRHDPIAQAYEQWVAQGWGDVADYMAAITSVMRVGQIMLAEVEAVLKRHGLSFARYELLALLAFNREPMLPMAKISARLQVHPTSVTSVVDRLEAAGLVVRQRHPSDRRTTLVEITKSGRALTRKATVQLNRQVFVDPGMPPEDVRALNAILARYRRSKGDFIEHEPAASWTDAT